MPPIQIIKPCVLLVEGKDDRLFFEAYCSVFNFIMSSKQ